MKKKFQKINRSEQEITSFNPWRQGGRLLSALNRPSGIGNPYCKIARIDKHRLVKLGTGARADGY